MANIGEIALKTAINVDANDETRLIDLFDFSERSKQFVILQQIVRDQSKLKIKIEKVGGLEIVSDANLQERSNASLVMIMK